MNAISAEKSAWLTPKELRGWHAPHLGAAGLWRRLAHPSCPPFQSRRGPTGRRVLIEPTPALLAFLALRRAAPGLQLSGLPMHPQHQPHVPSLSEP